MIMPIGRALLGAVGALLAAGLPAATPLPMAPSPEAQGFSGERLKRLDGAVAQAVADGRVSGALTLLARHGKVIAVRQYGDAAPGRPMSRDAIFRIYSMTKPVTGVAMMMLFEEGKWALDDPITKYIPEFADLKVATSDAAGNPILVPVKRPPTMRELMSHTAGFAYGQSQRPADRVLASKAVLQADGLDDMIRRLTQVPLLFQPGEQWSYSAAVDVQGYLVEKLSGMKFGQFLEQRIFGPLRMTDTGFYVPAAKAGRLASIYTNDPQTGRLSPGAPAGRTLSDPARPPALESGGGGLFSTLDDYSRFAQMLANKGQLDGIRLLSPAAVELMQTNVVAEKVLADPDLQFYKIFNPSVGFGLDFQVTINPRAAGRMDGPGTMSWEGAAGTWFWADPANEVIFVGMVQNFARAGPAGFDPITRPLVYQALVDPKK